MCWNHRQRSTCSIKNIWHSWHQIEHVRKENHNHTLHLKALAVNIIDAPKFILYNQKKKKPLNWVTFLNMWSDYLFDVCIRKIHLCAFLIYGSGRQTGWKTKSHGNQPSLQPNDRLQHLIQTQNCHLHLWPFFLLHGDNRGKWCHASLEPPIYTLWSILKKNNNNPAAFQLDPWKTPLFPLELLLSNLFPYFIKRTPCIVLLSLHLDRILNCQATIKVSRL